MTGFEVYKMYLSLKLHFTSKSYDYFQYNGACKATQESFDRRKDKYFFVKLSRKFKEIELREFFVSNLIVDGGQWVGQIAREGSRHYTEYQKRIQSLSYIFSEDVATLHNMEENFDDLFRVKGVHPTIVKAHLGGKISLETLTIFNMIFGFVEHFDKTIKDEIVWKPLRNKVVKYEPFLNVDCGKYKSIIKREYV